MALHRPIKSLRRALTRAIVAFGIVMGVLAAPAFAQVAPPPPPAPAAPPPPPKIWTVTAGAGLALTSGNSDTSTINANYTVVFDPRRRNLVKSEGLWIRGETEGDLSANSLAFNIRDEYRLTGRLYVFGQQGYLRDTFKEIDYLLATTGGLGVKLIDRDTVKLSTDGGVGGVWEKNLGLPVRSSGALTANENFTASVTENTILTQSFGGLWKTDDFDDTLFRFSAGVAVSMSQRTQLKVEALDIYKNKPPSVGIEKNDVSLIVAFVFKN